MAVRKLTMNEAFNPRELTKVGFERTPSEDFSDDGTRFRCYKYKGFRISYAAGLFDDDTERTVFISAHPDDYKLNFSEYRNLPSYEYMNKYNNIAESKVDVQDLKQGLDKLDSEIMELKKSFSTASAEKIKKYFDAEEAFYIDIYDKFRTAAINNFDALASCFTYNNSKLIYAKNIFEYLNHAKQDKQRAATQRDFYLQNPDDYKLRELLSDESFKKQAEKIAQGPNASYWYKAGLEYLAKIGSKQ